MINISISKTAEELGARAADKIEELINQAIAEKGEARIILSTGMSQFETLSSLVKRDIDWSNVEMFHLDEYIGLDESHPASFIKYLKERFTSLVPLKSYHFVTSPEILEELGKELDYDFCHSPEFFNNRPLYPHVVVRSEAFARTQSALPPLHPCDKGPHLPAIPGMPALYLHTPLMTMGSQSPYPSQR